MKKMVVLFLLLVLMIMNYNTIFASLQEREHGKSSLEKKLQLRLEEIFQKRIEVWNAIMIQEKSCIDTIEAELYEIITEPLLSIDIETFQYIIENPTSYEIINDFTIKSCKITRSSELSAQLIIDIIWEIESFSGIDREEMEYMVEMKKVDGKWLLSDYNLSRKD